MEGCEWFTHDSSIDACYTFETCTDIDESCATCVSGEDECEPEEPQPTSNTIHYHMYRYSSTTWGGSWC